MQDRVIKGLKIVSIIGGIFFAIVMGYSLFMLFTSVANDPDKFKVWLDGFGWFGKAVLVIMMGLQVLVAFLPGEIIELGAGVAYGTVEGMILCLIGAAIGSYIILILVKRYGVKLVEHFMSKEKINQLSFLKDEKKLNQLVFIIFFIPGTPKDFITYFAGLTSVKIWNFIGITTIARIPSVVTSTIAGDYLINQDYLMVAGIYLFTLIVSLGGLYLYNKIMSKHKGEIHHEDKCIDTSI
ncbi:TVP38/TMEM64 family protein [Anaerorhabdus sp.]|uniref:TVP38/TMEM64 family protein n=1 Tax=Anaerorhabdus sp. TaxID=1872524 RepID=UPI002FC9DC11